MSLDRMQSVPGRLTLSPEATPTDGFPGEVCLGMNAGIVKGAAAQAGGALYTAHTPKSGAPTVVAGNGTISHSGYGMVVVDTAGAVTGIIVQAGTVAGQRLTIANKSANSLTMAAAGTSNVINGTGCVISATAAVDLIWNALDSRWYQTRAA